MPRKPRVPALVRSLVAEMVRDEKDAIAALPCRRCGAAVGTPCRTNGTAHIQRLSEFLVRRDPGLAR